MISEDAASLLVVIGAAVALAPVIAVLIYGFVRMMERLIRTDDR